ncbi:MAG: hypothetical protein HOE19_03800 [Candidatus Komeilibacteria bacterium]|jgi:RNA-directed DNA polymerase|nr:hypothetical protein [Candidatus Komeilibacteria bacterium]MBT4447801.1 hypothetical protein [Candidatus Komeilibacteria bacterium]
MNLQKLKREWLKLENDKVQEKRKYKQFNYRVKNISEKLAQKIWEPAFVAGYSFYPFIKYYDIQRKCKRDPKTSKIYISKKERPICLTGHKESIIVSWYAHLLSHIYEIWMKKYNLENEVIAYRSIEGKSSYNFASDVFNFCKKQKESVILTYDIKGFFDNLDHKIIKKLWVKLLKEVDIENSHNGLPKDHYAVYKYMTSYSFVNINDVYSALGLKKKDLRAMLRLCSEDDFHQKIQRKGKDKSLIQSNKPSLGKRGFGIPQGAAISAVLSNMYMIDFDRLVSTNVKKIGGLYRRYSDDIVVVVPTEHYKKTNQSINNIISKILLELEPTKTTITKVKLNKDNNCSCYDLNGKNVSVPYLGVEWDGKKILLRGKTLARYHRRMSKAVYTVAKNAQLRGQKYIPKRRLYEAFTGYGKSNFQSYVLRAGKGIKSKELIRQISKHKAMQHLKKKIKKTISKLKNEPKKSS